MTFLCKAGHTLYNVIVQSSLYLPELCNRSTDLNNPFNCIRSGRSIHHNLMKIVQPHCILYGLLKGRRREARTWVRCVDREMEERSMYYHMANTARHFTALSYITPQVCLLEGTLGSKNAPSPNHIHQLMHMHYTHHTGVRKIRHNLLSPVYTEP